MQFHNVGWDAGQGVTKFSQCGTGCWSPGRHPVPQLRKICRFLSGIPFHLSIDCTPERLPNHHPVPQYENLHARASPDHHPVLHCENPHAHATLPPTPWSFQPDLVEKASLQPDLQSQAYFEFLNYLIPRVSFSKNKIVKG